MTAKEILLREAERLPEPLAQEVLDFLRCLRERSHSDTGGPGDDTLAYRIAHPWKVADFKPLSRDHSKPAWQTRVGSEHALGAIEQSRLSWPSGLWQNPQRRPSAPTAGAAERLVATAPGVLQL